MTSPIRIKSSESWDEYKARMDAMEQVAKDYYESYDLLSDIHAAVTAEDYRDGWSNAVAYIQQIELRFKEVMFLMQRGGLINPPDTEPE